MGSPNPLEHLYASRASRMNASEIRELLKLLDRPEIISFAGGIPDPELFPQARIEAAYRDTVFDGERAKSALQYSVSEGYLPLRQWIAGYMSRKGVPCEAANILITNGSQQALDFICKLFVSPGDGVLVERPTYLGFLQSVQGYEPTLREVEISGDSVRADGLGEAERERAKLLYLIPDFANPSGRTMTAAQRRSALDLARELDLAVVEDAAYADLGHEGQTNPPLLALECERTGSIDRSKVLFCGTFSKIFAPGMRVGWVCAASAIIEKLVLIKQAADLHSSTINQIVIERLASECYDEQAAMNRKAYAERKTYMLDALARHMPQGVRWTTPEGGMFVWIDLPEGLDGAKLLVSAIKDYKVAYVPGAPFYASTPAVNTIRLSFSLGTRERIEEGVRRIAALVAAASDEIAPKRKAAAS